MDERRLVQREGILSREQHLTCFEREDEMLPITAFFQMDPYKHFVEFCDTCRRFRYVGICYGAAGVGKTVAARLYADWDAVEPLLTRTGVRMPAQGAERPYPRVALYSPERMVKPKQLANDIALLVWSLQNLEKISMQQHLEATGEVAFSEQLELLIIDNVQRLDVVCMDVVQDLYDRYQMGVVLLGDEVLVKKHLVRLEHLRVRVGDVCPFPVLGRKEVGEIIPQLLSGFGIDFQSPQGLSLEAVADIIDSATNGNLSLIRHFLTQIVVLMQKEKADRVSMRIVEKAYAKLRMS